MSVEFDPQFFRDILGSREVAVLCEQKADAAHAIAYANAPVDTGDYRQGLEVRRTRGRDGRVMALLVGTDWKTLLVESQTGNLARAIRAVK